MPELPDVEGFRRVLVACVEGRRVERVEVIDPGVLHDVSGAQLRRRLKGRRVTGVRRHGKWLLLDAEGTVLALHFGMTGELVCCHTGDPRERHDRVVIAVDTNRELRYRDQRKLQGLWLLDATEVDGFLAHQGPDAMTVSAAEFDRRLARRRGVKALLMDQSALAGLGNLLTDEILWRARLHPARRADNLSDEERGRLRDGMRRVLRAAVADGRVPERETWLTGHRDDPRPRCPRCHGTLRRSRVAGRTTVWCPRCQRAPGSR